MKALLTCMIVVMLGTCLAGKASAQDVKAEIDRLEAALHSNPDDIGTRLQLITILFMDKHYRDVINVSQKAIQTLPQRASLYYLTGESYRQLGNIDSAYIVLKKGYDIRPFADLSESYAMVLLRLKKKSEAVAILREVAKEKSNFLDNHYKAGVEAYKEGRMRTATDELLAVYLVDKSKLTKEQELFIQFNENFQDYIEGNNTQAAVTAFDMTLKAKFQGDYDFNPVSESFKCFVEKKQSDDARALFERFNTLQAGNFTQLTIDTIFLHTALAQVLRCPELNPLCKSVFKRVAKESLGLSDTDLTPLYSLYDFMLGQGATELTSELTGSVVDDTEGLHDPNLRLAAIFVKSNRLSEAVESVRRFFAASKLDQLGYTKDFLDSFRSLLTRNKTDEVSAILKELGALDTHDLVATYVMFGDFFVKMGAGEKAIDILNKVVAIDPANHVASAKLGEAYYSTGRYDEIIRFLGSTRDSEGLRYLALAYEKKMDLAEANQSWQSILAAVQDPARADEAREHIRQNTITMMSPQFQQLKARAAVKNSPVHLAITQPAGAVEDNSRGIALVVSDVPTVKFSGFAGSDSPIDSIMVNGKLVAGEQVTPEEAAASKLTTPYVVKFSTDLMLPPAQKSEVEVVTTDNAGNRAAKKYVVNVKAQQVTTGGLPTIRAFIVGISQYADKSLDLEYARADADLFYKRMRDPTTIGIPAANMVLLTDQNATRAGILDGLEKLLESSFENDVVLIYFAMHGVTEDDLLYFVPYDAKITSLRTTAISGLDMDYLIKTKGAGRKVIMFVDACHSGGTASSIVFSGTRGVSALPLLLTEMARSQPGLAVFSASDKGQVSREGEEWGGHGVFTYYLLRAITTPAANTNADQFIQLREIVDYVREKVSADTKGKQTPVFKCISCDPNMPLFYSK